ncbi:MULTISPECIES: hypothetical protein [Pseudomonas]|nr:hypothetical protein [Pseudomonas sp. DCB_BI]MCX2887783.1 hypothetical protein [Pseudomonas sp. DCB_BI]
MASIRTSQGRLDRLRRLGKIDRQRLVRIHARVVDSKTPAYIALAVLADVNRVSNISKAVL